MVVNIRFSSLVMGECLLVDNARITGVLRRGSIEGDELLRHLHGNTDLRLRSARAQMRRGHHLGMTDEGLGDRRLWRLLGINVEGRAGHFSALKAIEHGLLVDDAAPGHIHHLDALFALGQCLRRYEI